jgi:hypothetical protein
MPTRKKVSPSKKKARPSKPETKESRYVVIPDVLDGAGFPISKTLDQALTRAKEKVIDEADIDEETAYYVAKLLYKVTVPAYTHPPMKVEKL